MKIRTCAVMVILQLAFAWMFAQTKPAVITDNVIQTYKVSLARNDIKTATATNIIKQLEKERPIAKLDGRWIYALNVSALMGDKLIKPTLESSLGKGKLDFSSYPGKNDKVCIVVASTKAVSDLLGKKGVDNLPGGMLQQNPQGASGANQMGNLLVDVIIGPGIFGDITGLLAGAFCDAETGSGGSDNPATGAGSSGYGGGDKAIDDPNSDPDDDDVPNHLDSDDDGDGTDDDEDPYPYDPEGICHSCKLSGVDGQFYVNKYNQKFEAFIVKSYTSYKTQRTQGISINQNKMKVVFLQ